MDGGDHMDALNTAEAVGLNGAWHLADYRRIYAGGRAGRPWAGSGSGCLVYTPDGHMFKTISFPDGAGRIRCISYYGRYEIVEDRVIHRIAVSADIRDVGTVREGTFLLESDFLTLSFSPARAGGPGSSMEYLWRRAGSGAVVGPAAERAAQGNNFYHAR